MSFIPPLFTNFGKNADDLLSKKYGNKKEFKVKTLADGGQLTFESTVNFNDKTGAYNGSLKASQRSVEYGIGEAELDTTGKAKASFEFTRLFKGLIVKLTGTEKPNAQLDADYRQENVAVSASLVASPKPSVVLTDSIVVGVDGVSVGANVVYDATNQQVVDYNAGVEYEQPSFVATVKTADRSESVLASYFHKLDTQLAVGGRLGYNLTSGDRTLHLGSTYAFDANTVVKTKFNTDGVVEAAIEQRLANPSLLYGLSTKFDVSAKSTTPQEFGLSLQFSN